MLTQLVVIIMYYKVAEFHTTSKGLRSRLRANGVCGTGLLTRCLDAAASFIMPLNYPLKRKANIDTGPSKGNVWRKVQF